MPKLENPPVLPPIAAGDGCAEPRPHGNADAGRRRRAYMANIEENVRDPL